MTIPDLDELLSQKFTLENVSRVYAELKSKKTDIISGEIKIATGVDYCSYKYFEENLNLYSEIICEKGLQGKYCFNAFKEIEVPKPPYERHQIDLAREKGKIRTLSISTIQDTLFQILILESIYDYIEKVFKTSIDGYSFAYRKNKSSKMAVYEIRSSILEGYTYALDGDIKKFFDEIDHQKLMSKIEKLLGFNSLIENYIYRFIKTSRLPAGEKNKKTNYRTREIGIPQGGVLSGILANIFLYDFDKYVINDLSSICDFKYFRYADDFVLLFKSDDNIQFFYDKIKAFLENEGLTLHPLGEKTKKLNLDSTKKDKLDFLGFEISPVSLRVKKDNVKKLLSRIELQVKKAPAENPKIYLQKVIRNIRFKIVGLEDINSLFIFCPICCRCVPKRNWIGYFLSITDVRQLRNIDKKIKSIIHKDFLQKRGFDLSKNDYRNVDIDLISLEKTYYIYKKIEKKSKGDYCDCIRKFDSLSGKIEILKKI